MPNILQITTPVMQIALDELKHIGITVPQYTVNIIFNEIVDATKSAVALEKRNQTLIVFYGEPFFYIEKDSIDFVFGLQNTLLHEMLHLFIPLSFKDSILEPFDYNNLKMSGHLWLYEGFITYQTLKFLVANDLITKQKFIDEIEKMIGAYKGYERGGWSVPLYRSSIEAFEKPYLHHFFYNRSSILCFYSDLSIMEKSNGTKTFWDILSGIYKTTPVFHPDSLNNYLIQHTFPEFRDFIHTYITGAKYLDLKLFDQFGLNYVEINFTPTEKYIPINISSFKNGILNVVVREIGMPPSSTDKIISLTRINDLPISTYSINSIFRRAIPMDTISVEILQNGEKKLELIELFSARNISFYPNIVVSDSAFWDKYLSFTTSIE
jgi:hypothetical protein